MEKMYPIQNITDSDKKSPPLPVNDTQMPAKENIPVIEQKSPVLPENYINMLDYE